MRRYSITAIALLFCTALLAQVNIEDIAFKQKHINLGNLYLEGGIVPAIYEFTNNSTQPFNITSMEAACGCTKPETAKKVYLPGESGKIIVQFNPKGMIGSVEKWIYVRGNYANGFQIELDFKANIMVGETRENKHYPGEFGYLQMEKYQFNWGLRTSDDLYNDTMLLTNDGYNAIKIKEFRNLPSFITIQNMPIEVAVGDTVPLILQVDLRGSNRIGPKKGVVKMISNDRFYPMKEWKYSFEVYPNYDKWSKRKKKNGPRLAFEPAVVDIGKVKSGAKVTKVIQFKNEGKKELVIMRTEADCSCTLAELPKKTLQPGETMDVKVTFDSLFKEGLKRKVVTIYSNDPNNPKQTFIVQADVF